MAKIIPFTEKHEKLLEDHTKTLSEQSCKIEENTRVLGEHSKRIDQNTKSIELLTEETHRLGILMEDQKSTVETILEVVTHIDERLRRQDVMDQEIDNHENRIAAIETHVKAGIG